MLHLRKLRFKVRPVLSTIAGIAIAGCIVGMLGSDVAGLVAGSEVQKDRASGIALLSNSVVVLGTASTTTLSLIRTED